jgi:hypothetical protein
LSPGIPDTGGPLTVVVANSLSNHTDLVGVYLAFLPPGGTGNPGACAPAGVQNLGAFSLLPGEKITVRIDPPWACANPAAVNGQSWTLKAIADIHAEDFGSCTTLTQVFNGECNAAVGNDDNNNLNNTKSRSRPIVVALP